MWVAPSPPLRRAPAVPIPQQGEHAHDNEDGCLLLETRIRSLDTVGIGFGKRPRKPGQAELNKKRVTTQDQLGRIGNVTAKGSVPNHLHFAIYEESAPGSTRRLKSIDINVLPAAILAGITRWIDWRGDKARAIAGALPAAALGA